MPTPSPVRAGAPLQRLARRVSSEVTGGVLLLVAAVLALAWANSPWRDGYTAVSGIVIGPSVPFHLDLTLSTWAADGLLAVFFFVVGVELKHEFVAGSLRSLREAAVPMLAAVGGMIVPAVLFLAGVTLLGEPTARAGWAIPTATDIAFALAVLAVFGRGLPIAVRTFLLTLAVVDDLLAIVVIATFYTSDLRPLWMLAAAAGVVVFALLVRMRRTRWWLLLPVALLTWAAMHESGVHATVAGVLLGLVVPAVAVHGERHSRTHRFEQLVRPVSSGIALPVFAFFAAGVSLVGSGSGSGGLGALLTEPVLLATVVGLVAGKIVGVLGVTALVTRLTPLRLAPGIGVRDLVPVGILAGIGFTVSLLIAELSFSDAEHVEAAKAGVLGASLFAAGAGAIAVRSDARRARSADENRDDIPDVVTGYIGEPVSPDSDSPAHHPDRRTP